jgi:hypothetical protein
MSQKMGLSRRPKPRTYATRPRPRSPDWVEKSRHARFSCTGMQAYPETGSIATARSQRRQRRVPSRRYCPEPPQDGPADPNAGADGTRLRRRARLPLFQTTGLPAADPGFFSTIRLFLTLQEGPLLRRDISRHRSRMSQKRHSRRSKLSTLATVGWWGFAACPSQVVGGTRIAC